MWDLEHRPLKFSDVLGQPGTVQLLKSRLAKGTALDANYIFAGAFGGGKTTIARILARALLCQNLDKSDPEPCNECDNCLDVLQGRPGAYVEQDAASGGTIENIRGIIEDLPFAIFGAPKRVYVFDECHRLSRDAQDVLLKPLEEKRLVGIFCTTEPEKIRGPIRSRCEEYSIRKVTREDILARMKGILDKHTIPHDDDAVLTVIDYSGGHVRDILNRLEMVAQTGEVSLAAVREYLNLSVVSTYYEILLALREPKLAIALTEQLCDRLGADEVSAGLAEAAMNAFRLHHGMFADFVYVDKSLGQRLYAAYGNDVVRLAEHFLRQRYTSKIALFCDILNLGTGIPATVAVQAPAPILAVAGPPQETPVNTQSLPKDIPQPAQTSSSANNKTAPVFTNGKGVLRPDGVGNLGSSDVGALTSVDQYGVARQMPRGRAHVETPIQFSRTAESDDNKVLSPEEWKREFELTWPGRA